MEIRESEAADRAAIEGLYPDAFPDEDLLPLIRGLLSDPATLSLVAVAEGSLVGHVVFTSCGLDGASGGAALLGPLAVAPAWQRRGVGSALVRGGLERLARLGTTLVCVLGDPAYYGRFGFRREARVEPPYRLPEAWRDAWQSLALGGAAAPGAGRLVVPRPWRRRALWAP